MKKECWCDPNGHERRYDYLTVKERDTYDYRRAPSRVKNALCNMYIYIHANKEKWDDDKKLKQFKEYVRLDQIVEDYIEPKEDEYDLQCLNTLTTSSIPEEIKKMLVPGVDFATLDKFEQATQLDL